MIGVLCIASEGVTHLAGVPIASINVWATTKRSERGNAWLHDGILFAELLRELDHTILIATMTRESLNFSR